MHMTKANQVVEDEQPLVDLELLAHFEAQAEERAALVCEDDAELLDQCGVRLFGARRVA